MYFSLNSKKKPKKKKKKAKQVVFMLSGIKLWSLKQVFIVKNMKYIQNNVPICFSCYLWRSSRSSKTSNICVCVEREMENKG